MMFKRFGEIILINTVCSVFITMTLLPAMVVQFGPVTYHSSMWRSIKATGVLAVLFVLFTLLLYLMVAGGTTITDSEGEPMFSDDD